MRYWTKFYLKGHQNYNMSNSKVLKNFFNKIGQPKVVLFVCFIRVDTEKRHDGLRQEAMSNLYEYVSYIRCLVQPESILYNGICCIPGPDSNSTIFGSLRNRMSCVTDHTKGLEKDTISLFTLHSWRMACLTPSNVRQEDQRCSGSSSAELQNRHRLDSSSILLRCLLNHPCPVKN